MQPLLRAHLHHPLRTGLLLSWVPLVLGAPPAAANAPPAASVLASAAAGQQALALQASSQGVVARACSSLPCTADGGKQLDVPSDVTPLLARARAKTIPLAGGRHIVRVDAPGSAQGASWVMLVAAPTAKQAGDPIVIWSGWTGAYQGEDGLGRMGVIIEESTDRGSRILVGEQREDVTLCGRNAVVGVRELSPGSLALSRGVSVQNLSQAERAGATKVFAVRKTEPAADPAQKNIPTRIALLRATVASTALGKKFSTLTDGDLETTWSENKRSGDGRGEFVTMSSASEVPILGFEIAVRPAEADVPDGVAPRTLFLATEKRLFEVTMPEDGWQKPGARYEVKLSEPLRASCIAVVLDTAYAPASAKNPVVTLAEIKAQTEFDEIAPEGLAGALAGGGDRAKAAAALLMRAGPAGVRAVIQHYPKLDGRGRQLAMAVVDSAPCSQQAPFFAGMLIAIAPKDRSKEPARNRFSKISEDEIDPEIAHARDRIRRCGRAAAPVLAKLIAEAADPVKIAAAAELALIAPAEAVAVLVEAIGTASDPMRRELRASLSLATKSQRAVGALTDELEPERFGARSEIVQIDLLRAMSTRIGRISGASEAFHRLAVPAASFRTRYLLQAPAAALALAGDAQALSYLRSSLRKDPDAHVRARAAEVAGPLSALGADLIAAADDPEPRVREAAIRSLGQAQSKGIGGSSLLAQAAAVLGRRLASDPWTFVRTNAAQATEAFPASPALDRSLAAAVADVHPDVRGRALDALGAHRAVAHIELVRERAMEPEEQVEVRARAILALARMCDNESLDDWTGFAQRALVPVAEGDRRLGSAAVAALGEVHPRDLRERLAPLLRKDAPAGLREAAKAALAAKPSCR